jgi:hypothetical protein
MPERASLEPHRAVNKTARDGSRASEPVALSSHLPVAASVLALQRSAGNRAVSQMLQRQKTPGRYRLTTQARLRADVPNYPVLYEIPHGAHVQVQDRGNRISNFKAGSKTNEHSWSTWQWTQGWIEDSKLTAAPEPQQPTARTAGDVVHVAADSFRRVGVALPDVLVNAESDAPLLYPSAMSWPASTRDGVLSGKDRTRILDLA